MEFRPQLLRCSGVFTLNNCNFKKCDGRLPLGAAGDIKVGGSATLEPSSFPFRLNPFQDYPGNFRAGTSPFYAETCDLEGGFAWANV